MKHGLGGERMLRALRTDDVPAIQALAERCLDYEMLVNGEPAPPSAGQAFQRSGPPGHPPHATRRLGVEEAGSLLALVEMPTDYPAPGDWFISLLLIDPSARREGLGSAVVRQAEAWAVGGGAKRIELVVLDENTPALAFWRRLGYAEIGHRPPRRHGRKMHAATVFEKRVRLEPTPVPA